jgi:hypothetical protein
MTNVPFHEDIEELFASDKSIALKLLGGAFVGGFLGLRLAVNDPNQRGPGFSPPTQAIIAVGGAIVGALIVLILPLRDHVARRLAQGKRVNPLLRAYLGLGNLVLSLVLWLVTALIATFTITILMFMR